MTTDYFENLLKKPSLFLDEKTLDINYIPENLPHREKELTLLSQLFLTLITNPNSLSRKILITGRTGIGKTATVKLFGKMLIEASNKRDIQINYVHINCRKERTSYKVLIKIIHSMDKSFPKRGYSPQDLLEILTEYLNTHDLHLLIVLDELNYLIQKGGDLIYSLTRINDDMMNAQQRISIIGIVRDISCINSLDVSTMSTLQRNILKFENYTKKQIFDIMKYRTRISLKENAISDDILEMVAESVFKVGDIRYGLNLLWKASKFAESRNLKYINSECIRYGNQDLVSYSTQDAIKYLSIQKLIFLLSIIKILKKTEKSKISISEILSLYNILCENLGLKARSYSQLWNYLNEFEKENIIILIVKSEAIKGRKAFIEIQDIPLAKFEGIINQTLKSKGIRL
jgi:cell division control protein 6